MTWVELGNAFEEHHYQIDSLFISLVVVGKYYDNSNTYQISYDSLLVDMFDCERRFRSLEKCKKYAEKKVRDFYKKFSMEMYEVYIS